jgi:hypothetical protein
MVIGIQAKRGLGGVVEENKLIASSADADLQLVEREGNVMGFGGESDLEVVDFQFTRMSVVIFVIRVDEHGMVGNIL